jgi:hypothetical protein
VFAPVLLLRKSSRERRTVDCDSFKTAAMVETAVSGTAFYLSFVVIADATVAHPIGVLKPICE